MTTTATKSVKACTYEKGDRIQKAQQAYLVLIGMASRSQITTYAELARWIGYENDKGFNFVRLMLWPLAAWCEQRGLPILPAVVVNGKDGYAEATPIYGEPIAWAKELQRVFKTDWYAYRPPTLEELEGAITWAESNGVFYAADT